MVDKYLNKIIIIVVIARIIDVLEFAVPRPGHTKGLKMVPVASCLGVRYYVDITMDLSGDTLNGVPSIGALHRAY